MVSDFEKKGLHPNDALLLLTANGRSLSDYIRCFRHICHAPLTIRNLTTNLTQKQGPSPCESIVSGFRILTDSLTKPLFLLLESDFQK